MNQQSNNSSIVIKNVRHVYNGNTVALDGGVLHSGATPVAASNLEEAYLAFMAARGRSAVAAAGEEGAL